MQMLIRAALFLLALACWCASAATVVTKTLRQSGGDYATMASWQSARARNLVSADECELLVIEGSWSVADTNFVDLTGWTTDASHWIAISNSTSKHDGKRYGSASSAYRLERTDGTCFQNQTAWVRIYGLQIAALNCTSFRYGYNGAGGAGTNLIKDCIFYGTSSGSGMWGILPSSSETIDIVNCLGHGMTNGYFIVGQGTTRIWNCTARGGNYG